MQKAPKQETYEITEIIDLHNSRFNEELAALFSGSLFDNPQNI